MAMRLGTEDMSLMANGGQISVCIFIVFRNNAR